MKFQLRNIAAAVASICVLSPAHAVLDFGTISGPALPGGVVAPYVAYDDAKSYSLPVLGILYNIAQTGSSGDSIQPGNPYYVASSPGAIQDLIVIGTGSNGTPVTTNFAGMDNAYATPNSPAGQPFKDPFFSTGTTPDPDQVSAFGGDGANTWDMRMSAFSTYLNGEAPIFLFNNNQINSGAATNQSLAAWMAITLYDEQDSSATKTLYFRNRTDGSNTPGKFALVSEGGGGVLNGTVGNGTAGAATGPVSGTNASTDYVLSGGALCYSAALTVISCNVTAGDGSVSPNPLAVGGPINHNLGANQAVYALVFDELDRLLKLSDFGGYDYLSIDIRLGCDLPGTGNGNNAVPNPNCVGRSLNNGYQQLFIATATTTTNVPEPGTLALIGAALGGIALARRRKV